MSCRKGRHRKPPRHVKALTPAVTGAAITGMVLASPVAASAHTVPDNPAGNAPDPNLASITSVIQHYIPKHAGNESILVKSGDTLGSISAKACGTPDDWTGIYKKNRKVIGGNPDLILPGQRLVKNCRDVPLPRPKIIVAANVQSTGRHAASYSSSGGTFSFTGLEQLWVAAGGDSWAAPAAARVAECESGGDASNYYGKSAGVPYRGSSSQASGLWQILGQVIPGDPFNPMVNARNAVAKFNASGKTWAQWVCRP